MLVVGGTSRSSTTVVYGEAVAQQMRPRTARVAWPSEGDAPWEQPEPPAVQPELRRVQPELRWEQPRLLQARCCLEH